MIRIYKFMSAIYILRMMFFKLFLTYFYYTQKKENLYIFKSINLFPVLGLTYKRSMFFYIFYFYYISNGIFFNCSYVIYFIIQTQIKYYYIILLYLYTKQYITLFFKLRFIFFATTEKIVYILDNILCYNIQFITLNYKYLLGSQKVLVLNSQYLYIEQAV